MGPGPHRIAPAIRGGESFTSDGAFISVKASAPPRRGAMASGAMRAEERSALGKIASLQRNDREMLCDVKGDGADFRDGKHIHEAGHMTGAGLNGHHGPAGIMDGLDVGSRDGDERAESLPLLAMTLRATSIEDRCSIGGWTAFRLPAECERRYKRNKDESAKSQMEGIPPRWTL